MNRESDISKSVAILAPDFNGEDFENESSLRYSIYKKIMSLYLKGYSVYYCGCQQGFPLLVADTLIMIANRHPFLGIQVRSIVRCENQFNGYDSYYRELGESMFASSSTMTVLEDEEFTGSDIIQFEELIENASIILTYYDEKDPDPWVGEMLLPKAGYRQIVNLF